MDEFAIIEKYFCPLSKSFDGALELKDDAAIISSKPGYETIITKDALIEGVHFLKGEKPYNIAIKSLGVNLSDLAAMGATPTAYLLSVILPKNTSSKWFAEFSRGISDSIDKFGGALIGGDTVSHDGAITLTLTAIGKVKIGHSLKRSGAKEGDQIFVSGSIGDSYLGLQILTGKIKTKSEHLTSRYFKPEPRIDLGKKLYGIATSCTDISDGLIADLGNICSSSRQGAEIFLENIPTCKHAAKLVKNDPKLLIHMVTGGDDYELLFTAPTHKEANIAMLSKEISLPITKIGTITAGSGVKLLDSSNKQIKLEKVGYRHFD